jgi:uncharacterized membrane protein HdeD (DUF308 family)
MNDRARTIDRASRLWWVFLLRGIAGLLLGISVVLGSENTEKLASFIAAYWLIGALLTIRWVLANRWRQGSRLGLAAALTGIVAASFVLVRTLFERTVSVRFTLVTLGVAAALTGVLRLFGAIHDDDESVSVRWRWKRVILGSLEVALGVLLVFLEDFTPLLIVVVGVWGVVGGAVLLLDALKLRQLGRGSDAVSGLR